MTKIIFVQPSIPHYRIDFFRRLECKFEEGIRVIAGKGEADYLLSQELKSVTLVDLYNFFGCAISWQTQIISFPLKKNDVLILPSNPRNLSCMLLALIARIKGARQIWWGHFRSSSTQERRLYLRVILMRLLADIVLFYTQKEVDEFIEEYPSWVSRNDVFALGNGLDLAKIRFLRKSYESSKREASLLFIGRLTKKANLELYFASLHFVEVGVTTHVVGYGELYHELREIAEAIPAQHRTIWHGEVRDEKKIASFANICLGSIYPGEVGLSLIHAMSYGLPVIVHHNSRRHMPEFAAFEDGVTGLSFAYLDAESLGCQAR
jgi:glycosyltransferase involved in cell wall biosynthesis